MEEIIIKFNIYGGNSLWQDSWDCEMLFLIRYSDICNISSQQPIQNKANLFPWDLRK